MLAELFARHFGHRPLNVVALPQSGSNRKYYRLASATDTAIGVYSQDKKENAAFLSFSRSFGAAGLRVPEVYEVDEAYGVYLQQDLGDETLFSLLTSERKLNGGKFPPRMKTIYKRILTDLAEMQLVGREAIDYEKCYPRSAFDRQSMTWDLQYFKYYFLKLAHIGFDEQCLENDFEALMNFLLDEDCDYFLYRDFQSRNIMLVGDVPFYIDYQGGRRGAREYDVASLLYDAKADIPENVRRELLQDYINCLDTSSAEAFRTHFYGYVLIRIMQAMGAYGYRGFFERKSHFLKSIPFAIENLRGIINSNFPPLEMPELKRVLTEICRSESLQTIGNSTRLKVTVTSFSYKHGIPTDNSGNGGGYVFDCRALPNPGRYEQYKSLTGRDREVVDFFGKHADEMNLFLSSARNLLTQSIERYIDRGFTNLAVNFGCTGGQHRSVFCADAVAAWIRDTFDCDVELRHWEQSQL